MSIETVQDLFLDELKDIYSAEKQAIRAYPRIAKAVQSDDLKKALQTHLEQTKSRWSVWIESSRSSRSAREERPARP